MRLHTLRQLLTAVILLAATASCYNYDQEEIIDGKASQYINISVSVSVSNENMTRALPAGGETGDGLEKGNARENKVNTISLFFYEDNAGINTNENTKVSFFATYPVKPTNPVTPEDNYNNSAHNHQLDDQNVGWTGESNDNEVIYSTGDQILEENTLDVTKTYHVFVVANAPNELLANITAGVTTISSVRNMVVSSVYDGTGVKTNAQNFVMSSERDATATFTNRKIDAEKNTITYYFECIHIERLAARIDFLAKTKNPETGDVESAEYVDNFEEVSGYRYLIGKNTNDVPHYFVLTRITPFNLMNGNEYLLKRTDDDKPYLHKETNTNWVLDPYTAGKNSTTEHPNYLASTLNSVKSESGFANNITVTLSDCQTATTTEAEGGKFSITEGNVTADNIILNYPKENTLKGGVSPLYYYATGLAFEGYFLYADASSTNTDQHINYSKTRKVFYHFLRHQGEQDMSYQALTDEDLENDEIKGKLCPSSLAMNFGIVRNNIYRVSIESIKPDNDEIKVTLLIKVKKWDKFVHAPIYM